MSKRTGTRQRRTGAAARGKNGANGTGESGQRSEAATNGGANGSEVRFSDSQTESPEEGTSAAMSESVEQPDLSSRGADSDAPGSEAGAPSWLDRIGDREADEASTAKRPAWADDVPADETPGDASDLGEDIEAVDPESEVNLLEQLSAIAAEGRTTEAPIPQAAPMFAEAVTGDSDLSSELPEETAIPLGQDVGLSVSRLRAVALQMARRDAAAELPAVKAEGLSESELELRDRCTALFENWQSRERDRLNEVVGRKEEMTAEEMGRAGLEIDRFERTTSELFRLKKRWEANRRIVSAELDADSPNDEGSKAFKTRWYALAITFLGIVEFLANAPVFGALLPRDPLTERQLRYVAETSEGWAAGGLRVISQFILRPDAALLAAGVVTFLCVLAHFFGHSLRRLLVRTGATKLGERITQHSPMEHIVPMVLSGVGLMLVLGVLYEARVTLGEVATERFAQDSSVVEEFRRTASWQRVDGNLIEANDLANRADDLEALAKEQREYAASMSGLSLPILLLNTTLVLVAISAAYFHVTDRRRDRFNEIPLEAERRTRILEGEKIAAGVSDSLSRVVRHVRDLRSLLTERPLKQWPALVHQLEGVIAAYRAENGRARGQDTRLIPAFADAVDLGLAPDEAETRELLMRDPDDYQKERERLQERFDGVRTKFTEEATAW